MGQYIRWQTLIALSGIILLGLFLSSITVTRTTVLVPDTGGTYTEGMPGLPQYINPLLSGFNGVDEDLVCLIFDGLTRADGMGGLEGVLASDWEVSDDGLVYVFELRRDVYWHDGAPFTADDVIFTVGLMQAPDFPGAPYLGELWRTVTAEKLDEYTVRFTLSEPFPPFIDYTTMGILPSHLLGSVKPAELADNPFNLQPVGTGRFRLVEVNSEHALLEANPNYFGTRPRLKKLEFRFYPDFESVLTAYEEKEVQGISYVLPENVQKVESIPSLRLYTARTSAYEIVYLNLADAERLPFFGDKRVRQALLYALDRPGLLDDALYGQGLVAEGPILPWSWAYYPVEPTYTYDIQKAAELLDEAGWVDENGDGIRERDGKELAFSLLNGDDLSQVRVAKEIQKQWEVIGVRAEPQTLGAGLGNRLRSSNFEAALVEVRIAGDPDPYPFWHQTQIGLGQNYAAWDNREASEVLEQARLTLNRGKRTDLYRRFQEIFAEEVPSLVLYYPVYAYAVDEQVKDVQIAPMVAPCDRFRNVADWYVLTRRVILSEAQHAPAILPTEGASK